MKLIEVKDPFLWLEEVEGEKPLAWVKGKSQSILQMFSGSNSFKKMETEALAILEDKDKIPGVRIRGNYLYNFWQDKKNIRGLWRRTTLSSYQKKSPQWENLLDIDQLAKKEKENWIYKGSRCLAPEFNQCLVFLSRGGKDARITREYNIKSKEFVKDGFNLEEAKSEIEWLDQNNIYVATDFGKDSLTDSGYPRILKLWTRGESLESAKIIKITSKDSNGVGAWIFTDGKERNQLVINYMTFFTNKAWQILENGLQKIPKQDSADVVGIFNGHFILQLRKEWQVANKSFSAGSLVALKQTAIDKNKVTSSDVLNFFVPEKGSSILGMQQTEGSFLINTLENVKGQIHQIFPKGDGFSRASLIDLGQDKHIVLNDASVYNSIFTYDTPGFLEPQTLDVYDTNKNKSTRLKSLKAQFNSQGMSVQQKWSTSADGTKVPYFLVGKDSSLKKGQAPTLLAGYGGFEISMTPYYSSILGKLWLEKGGVYALANIRGGGEFGPEWHQAALKKNRHKAFEDFIGVAEHLIQTGVTTKNHLAILGGSNGGLLVGSVMIKRPDLFKAVICQVPLLDMLRYSQLLAGASWIGEYGDPKVKDMREYLRSYSPYHNVEKTVKYPSLLLMTSTKDDRVHPGHARKMAAKMLEQGHSNVFYYENTEGGHSASANLKQYAKQQALQYEFLREKLELKN